jgi:hypothetical protein
VSADDTAHANEGGTGGRQKGAYCRTQSTPRAACCFCDGAACSSSFVAPRCRCHSSESGSDWTSAIDLPPLSFCELAVSVSGGACSCRWCCRCCPSAGLAHTLRRGRERFLADVGRNSTGRETSVADDRAYADASLIHTRTYRHTQTHTYILSLIHTFQEHCPYPFPINLSSLPRSSASLCPLPQFVHVPLPSLSLSFCVYFLCCSRRSFHSPHALPLSEIVFVHFPLLSSSFLSSVQLSNTCVSSQSFIFLVNARKIENLHVTHACRQTDGTRSYPSRNINPNTRAELTLTRAPN